MKILGNRILIKYEKKENINSFGIILPSTEADNNFICEVIGVSIANYGKNGESIEVPYKVGDTIATRQLGEYIGENLYILDCRHIVGVLVS